MKCSTRRIAAAVPGMFLLLVPLLLITGFLLVPILNLLYNGAVAALSIKTPLPDYFWPHLLRVTGNTFVLGITTTGLSLLIALPLAFALTRTDVVTSRFWFALLTIPMITPPFITAFAVLSLYGRSGMLSILLENIGVNLPLIFGLPGLVITQLTVSVPYAVFIIAAGLQGVPRHIDESAASMGAHPVRILFTLTLPSILPHILIAGLMNFLVSIGDVGGPLIIGGGFQVIATEIYNSFLSLMNDERIALIFSLWIILLSFCLLFFVNIAIKFTSRQYRTGTRPVMYSLRKFRFPVTFSVGFIVVLLLLPFIVIVMQSIGTLWTYSLLPEGWTLKHYFGLFKVFGLIKDTLILVLTAAPVIVLVSLVLGHTTFMRKKWRSLNYIMVIPFVLPGVVIAAGVLQSYAGLFSTEQAIPFYALLVLTIIMRRIPYSLKMLEAGFTSADPRREEAARSLGSNRMTAFLKVTLPQIKMFVFAAVVISIIKTATELSASIILAPPNWRSLSLGIVYFIEQGQLPRAAAMSVILIAVVGLGTFAIAYWFSGYRKNGSNPDDELEQLVMVRAPISFPRASETKKRKFTYPRLKRYAEPLLVVDERRGIVKANRGFLNLAGADSLQHLKSETSFSVLFFEDRRILELFTSGESIENSATSLMDLNRKRVPILLNAYCINTEEGVRQVYFYCRRVSGYSSRVKKYDRLRQRMAEAEQNALKAQITPHFLFNSLNSVIQLIETDPDEAKDVVQDLADLYRYILSSTKKNLVTVCEEIAFIRKYLAIEKARFGSNLSFTIDVSPVCKSSLIPPLILQPIVENAVNYGARDTGELDIDIRISCSGGTIVMQVMDRGSMAFNPDNIILGTGTGIKNVEGRLFALYHRKISFQQRKGGGLRVTITIPEGERR